MKYLLPFSALLALLAPLSVHAATCSALTGMSCNATDFTLATCDPGTKVCGCKDGYVAVRSGCAKKLDRPTVTVAPGRTNEVIAGMSVTLTCSTEVPATGSYEWKKGGTSIANQNGQSYTFTATVLGDVGGFSCIAKFTDDTSGAVLTSDESANVTIKYVNTTMKSAAVPEVSGIPAKAADGATLRPMCTNIPMGATYKFVFNDDDDSKNVSEPFPLNSTTQQQIRCLLEGDYFMNRSSSKVKMPSSAADIESATAVPLGAAGTDYVYKIGTTGSPTLTCITNPAAMYMAANGKTITYTFEDSAGDTSSVNGSNYKPDSSKAGDHKIYCTAAYDSKDSKKSANVTVTFSDSYITDPTLMASGTKLLAGSRLVLVCGSKEEGVTYSWMIDSTPIARQMDRIIQFDNFTSEDAKTYMCTATKNNFQTSSNVTIELASSVAKPTVRRTDSGATFGENGDYNLECKTDSATLGMVYMWKKGTANLTTTASIHRISSAKASEDDGNYTCIAKFDSQMSQTSDPLEVKIVEAGKPCTAATEKTDCVGDEYKGTCSKEEPYRCDCAANYIKKGDVCMSHGVTVLSSALLVAAAAIFSRLV